MQPENQNELDQRLSRLYAAPVPESFETGWRADIRREESIQTMKSTTPKSIWKRLAPALCALVLVAGTLWTGWLNGQTPASVERSMQPSANGASRSMSAKYAALSAEDITYQEDSASFYDEGEAAGGATQLQAQSRKLVRTVDLTVHTKAFDDTLAQVQQTLDQMGGYIENLYQYGETVRRINLTMRVPSERLDDFLASMEVTGKVTNCSESTVDMTMQYVDNQARLKTLYEKRDRLGALLAQAETVEDLIQIEGAIADTQYQIDSYETSQRSIDRQVEMSAVTLQLIEQEQTVVNPELTLAERIRAGFTDSLQWLGAFARDAIVFIVMALPVIAVIAALCLVWKLIRKCKKREE